jgi:hypothetical protein
MYIRNKRVSLNLKTSFSIFLQQMFFLHTTLGFESNIVKKNLLKQAVNPVLNSRIF